TQLKRIIEEINSCEKEIDIGKIEQSVEAGSEKSPVSGSIIETLQNSVDAIKSFFRAMENQPKEVEKSVKSRRKNKQTTEELTHINYHLETVQSKNNILNNHLCLTIKDNIGFNTFPDL